MRLDDLSSDLILNVLSSLNVLDHGRVSLSSRRLCYLVNAVQTKIVGPECVASSDRAGRCAAGGGPPSSPSSSTNGVDHASVIRSALSGMRSRPTLAMTFFRPKGRRRGGPFSEVGTTAAAAVAGRLPPDCAVLGALSSGGVQSDCGDGADESGTMDGNFACLLAAFDRERTSFAPFCLPGGGRPRRRRPRLSVASHTGADIPSPVRSAPRIVRPVVVLEGDLRIRRGGGGG